MNKNYFVDFIKREEFPISSYDALYSTFDKLKTKEEEIDDLIELYKIDMLTDFLYLINKIKDIAKDVNVNEYSSYMVFLILLSEELKNYYHKFDISDNIFYDTLKDLKWKLLECKLAYNVYGTFVPTWYDAFFRLYRFTFNRLQFEINKFDNRYTKNNVIIYEDDPVISIHIPRTETKLDMNEVEKSFQMAEKFFDKILRKDVIPFVFYSWIMYPGIDDAFKKEDNLYKFRMLFDRLYYGDYDNYDDMFHVFDKIVDTNNISALKEDTRLQKIIKERIKENKKMGYGFGIYLYRRSKE